MAGIFGKLCIATDRLRGDLRQSVRALARRPAFTLPAVVTLALGIGGTTAMFSIVDALLLRPPPYPDPAAIVTVATGASDARVPWAATSDPAAGRQLRLPPFDTPLEVIGVVADVREVGLDSVDRYGEVYLPVRQPGAAAALALDRLPEAPFVAVRTAGDPESAVSFLREAVAEVAPYARLDDVRTLDARLSESVASPRFHALLAAVFSALALVLTATGIYGLLSFVTSERRREMGLRLALGARRGDILALVVGRGAALVVVGLAAGIPAAAAATRLLESLLFGIGQLDGRTFLAAPLLVAAAALLACWLPARRVSRIDPAAILRAD